MLGDQPHLPPSRQAKSELEAVVIGDRQARGLGGELNRVRHLDGKRINEARMGLDRRRTERYLLKPPP